VQRNAFKDKGIVPNDFSFGEFPDDFDHFEPYLEKSFKRLPLLENAGIRNFFQVQSLLLQIHNIY
jgi:4-methylaminobutanoate oxidase (formaldehyde-forming)